MRGPAVGKAPGGWQHGNGGTATENGAKLETPALCCFCDHRNLPPLGRMTNDVFIQVPNDAKQIAFL